MLYVIEIAKRTSEKYKLEKRFSEFDNLHKNLSKLFNNLPKLPGKTLLKLSKGDDLEKRREGLDQYLKVFIFTIYAHKTVFSLVFGCAQRNSKLRAIQVLFECKKSFIRAFF